MALIHLDAGVLIGFLDADDAHHTAARLRARHRALRLPDALVIATAVVGHADRLFTTDRRWPSSEALDVTVAITTV